MHRVKFYAKGFWTVKHLSEWTTVIMIVIHIGLGFAVLFGGIVRFAIPSYNPLIYYSGGEVWIWGVWILLSAALMTAPYRWPNILGLWLGLCWHIIWMSCFTIALIRYETAAATPIPVYGGLAMFCAALLTAKATDKT